MVVFSWNPELHVKPLSHQDAIAQTKWACAWSSSVEGDECLYRPKWQVVVFMKCQNKIDSSQWAIYKFAWPLGRYEPTCPSTKSATTSVIETRKITYLFAENAYGKICLWRQLLYWVYLCKVIWKFQHSNLVFLSPTPTLMAFTGVTNAHGPSPQSSIWNTLVGEISQPWQQTN